jgi:hypothetical protein
MFRPKLGHLKAHKLKKKYTTEEDNIKLYCTECIMEFRDAGFVNLCIFFILIFFVHTMELQTEQRGYWL